jgi:hypothetical protein
LANACLLFFMQLLTFLQHCIISTPFHMLLFMSVSDLMSCFSLKDILVSNSLSSCTLLLSTLPHTSDVLFFNL